MPVGYRTVPYRTYVRTYRYSVWSHGSVHTYFVLKMGLANAHVKLGDESPKEREGEKERERRGKRGRNCKAQRDPIERQTPALSKGCHSIPSEGWSGLVACCLIALSRTDGRMELGLVDGDDTIGSSSSSSSSQERRCRVAAAAAATVVAKKKKKKKKRKIKKRKSGYRGDT